MDCPYCSVCIEKSKLSHTYKVHGKPLYMCGKCKKMTSVSDYPPEALMWRSDPEKWRFYMITKKPELVEVRSV